MNYLSEDSLKLLIYALVLFYCVFQMGFYATQVGGFPDESAHMSHISHLSKNGGFMHQFEEIKKIMDKGDYYISLPSTNYTAHPPLYYKIMSVLGDIKYEGNKIYLSILRFRFINIFITGLGIVAMFYIGFLLELSVFETLFYAAACVSVPMLTYVGGGVNNDNLSYLVFSLVIIGLIYFERDIAVDKERFFPYLLIGSGFMLTMLTKFTLGIVISFTLMFYLFYYYRHHKELKIIKNKYFAYTFVFYLIPAAYYIYIIFTYHTVQPSLKVFAPQEFIESGFYVKETNRVDMTFSQYFLRYWRLFLATWIGIWSHIGCIKRTFWEGISYLLLLFIPFIPIFRVIITKFSRNKYKIDKNSKIGKYAHIFMIVFIALIITMFIQYIKAYTGFLANGYTGSFQSRYYLFALPALAVLNIKFLRHLKSKIFRNIIFTVYVILFLYQDFIYFLLNYKF